MDPGLFEVFAVCYRVGDVFLGDDAYRLAGVRVQDPEGARARVLHNVGGCGRVVVRVCRREWWPHHVRDHGRGGWLSGLLRGAPVMIVRLLRGPSGREWPSLGFGWEYRSGGLSRCLRCCRVDA